MPIGAGQKNEITGEIWWSEQHPRADRDGTAGIDHQEPEPMLYEVRVPEARVRRIEIVRMDTFPPSVNEVLRDFDAPPLRFQRREAALAAAVLLALEVWDENLVSQTTIDCEGEDLKLDEVVERLRNVQSI